MAALLEWVQDDPRNLFSMFFQRDYAEQDWVMEADLYKDEDPHCPECQAVAGFCDLIHHSYVVAVNGDNDCGMCGYLFQDPNGHIHTAYDDDAGILVLYAFRDKAAAAAAFELYIHSPEYGTRTGISVHVWLTCVDTSRLTLQALPQSASLKQ